MYTQKWPIAKANIGSWGNLHLETSTTINEWLNFAQRDPLRA